MEENNKKVKSLSLSTKSFIVSMVIILALMIFSYVLTFILPAGAFDTALDSNGNNLIVPGTYHEVRSSFNFLNFIFSPILVLGSDGNLLLIAILLFLLVIGGTFQVLNDQGIIEYLLKKLINKFYKKRYILLIILPTIFMLLASCAGCFEEIIPLVPLMVALAISLGWDNNIGIGFSIFACGCGYAAGIINPFGTGVAQKVAGDVSVFSGVWFRIIVFIVLDLVLTLFLLFKAKKIEKKNPDFKVDYDDNFKKDKKLDHAVYSLLIILGIGILIIVCSTFLTFLQDYTLYIFAFCFLLASVVSSICGGTKTKTFFKSFLNGVITMLPAALMILCASSIKYILQESSRLDTLINYLLNATNNLSPYALILFIYLIVLLVEFFIPSGSAKAFLLIPLILPIAKLSGLSTNLVVLAYIFGDGLANVIYPTNPGLLISLNLANSSYGEFIKKNWLLIITLLVSTVLLLCFGLAISYY